MTLRKKTLLIITMTLLSLIVILYFISENVTSIAYLMLAVVAISVLCGVVGMLFLEKLLLSRLSRLIKSVSSIGTSGDISARVSMTGTDELSDLAGTINGMLAALQQSQGGLRESERRYRLLAENVTDVIWIIDTDLRFTYVSPSVTRLAGFSVEEATNQTLAEVLTPASLDAAMKAFAEEVAMEKMKQKDISRSRTLEVEVRRKDGSTVWCELRMTALRDRDGQAVGILGVARDITERRRADECLRFSDAAFGSIQESVVATDVDYTITHWNEVSERIYGIKASEAIGRKLFDVIEIVETSPGENVERVKKLETQGHYQDEVLHRTKRAEVWVNVSVQAIERGGKRYGWVALATDITERKQAQEKLKELYEREKELRHSLEEEMKRRVEFTRTLVHELKTPITPVLSSSELLLEELKEGPLLELAQNINQGASNLNQRIDELLDLARGEMGVLQLTPGPVDPMQLFQGIVSEMTPLAQRNGQSLSSELPSTLPTIWADEVRLRQVIFNLVNNAFKFTPKGGRITLRAKEDGANLIVEVQDTGRGISQEEQERLFEPYHRLESDRAHLSGLGLGLALSKQLVELHGGRIWVKSRKGRGSTFSFSVPIEAASEREENVEREGKS